jgi:heme-degrading monooxygenase HmoA
MTRISVDGEVVTLINVFTVAPEDQQRLVDLLVGATEDVVSGRPGYVSASIHKSLDGTRVTNYAQWRSREDFEAMFHDPDVLAHVREAERIVVSYEPHLYEVEYAHAAS